METKTPKSINAMNGMPINRYFPLPQKAHRKNENSSSEDTNSAGRFHFASGPGVQNQMVFTVLQYGHAVSEFMDVTCPNA
jgi:hypothetical protein